MECLHQEFDLAEDDTNFQNYQQGKPYRYYGYARTSPFGEDHSCMKYKCLLAAIGGLLITLQARGGSEEMAINDLPPVVENRIKNEFIGKADAKIIYVRKETEDDKECYCIIIAQAGQIRELYVSPDGVVVAYKNGPTTLDTFVDSIIDYYTLFALLAGTIPGLLLRWLVQSLREKRLSVLSGWLWAWLGTSIAFCFMLLSLPTIPREKDLLMVAILSIAWGAIPASLAETISLTVLLVLGYRSNYWRQVIGLCGVGLAFLFLTIPVDILRRERENQHLRAFALRTPKPSGTTMLTP